MNTSTDFERIAQDWLQDGPTELPDRTLQAALDEVHVTSQQRFGAARRTIHMNGNAPRFAVAAVIGLLILIGGGIYLGNNGSGGIGAPAATATPTAAPSATPFTTPAQSTVRLTPGLLCSATYCPAGTLEPGTFYIEAGGYSPSKLTFTMPAGWSVDFDGFVSKHVDEPGEVSFATWDVTHIFADACNDSVAPVSVGTTAAELASALAAQPGHSSSAVTDVVLGGFPGKRIEMVLPADVCNGGVPRFWPGPGPDPNSGFCCTPGGSTETVYAVDVAPKRVVVVAHHRADSSPADQAELQAIIDSMVFEPPATPTSPAP